ncbi:XdhC family protein [Halopenitus sp. H-Gu1]|uniref:XdhC family protein n=1 Tax=Halopenitus sp. H-Gu1 TaxID=3242697 RepID=UPI00359EF23B
MTAGDWSVPETEVMDAIDDAIDDRHAVLATVVDVVGNAYRRPGAKMVIAEEGDGVGSITAGCLEDEVLDIAEDVITEGRPHVEQFDLTGDDDVWGLGVGCNGIIDILLEPLDDSYRPVVDAYERSDDIAVVTVLDPGESGTRRGDRAYATQADGSLSFDAPDWPDWLLDALDEPTAELLSAETSDTLEFEHEGENTEVFVDAVTAPPDLVVFGSGHDVAPVANLTSQVDFRVTVASFRGASATTERFPDADAVVSTSPADVQETLDLDEKTYTIVMTHNFIDDRIVLEELLDSPVPYVGLLGPRERFEEIRDDLREDGVKLTEDDLERIFAPAGLDLGGGTPFHIAQSIAAEVTAIRYGREPKHLTEREGHIHERPSLE